MILLEEKVMMMKVVSLVGFIYKIQRLGDQVLDPYFPWSGGAYKPTFKSLKT